MEPTLVSSSYRRIDLASLNADAARDLNREAQKDLASQRDQLLREVLLAVDFVARHRGMRSLELSRDTPWHRADKIFPREQYPAGIPDVVVDSITEELRTRGFLVGDTPVPAGSQNAPRLGLGLTIAW